jgi:hypothetical protein
MIGTTYVHDNHGGYWKHGDHCMWETFVRIHVYTLNFKRFQIQQWFLDRKANCMHEVINDKGSFVNTNQLGVMVDRWKRFCE